MRGAWVILEGPDGAGKTTLAARIATLLSDPRSPAGAPTVMHHLTSESEFEEYGRPHMWTRAGLNVVQDRCLLSDLVYAPVWVGTPSRLGETRVRRALNQIVGHAVMIHVTAEEDDLVERMAERQDERENADPHPAVIHALLKNYWREVGWWRDIGGTVYEVDTTGGNFPGDLETELLLSLLLEEHANGPIG